MCVSPFHPVGMCVSPFHPVGMCVSPFHPVGMCVSPFHPAQHALAALARPGTGAVKGRGALARPVKGGGPV